MEPFIGQIIMFGGNFAPKGWAYCNGQLLPIAENQALFSLLGTTYGGDGRTTFALPDLRGRVAIQPGRGAGLSDYHLGERGGAEQVTLDINEIPSHTHLTQNVPGADQHVLLSTENAVRETPIDGDIPAVANYKDGLVTNGVNSFGSYSPGNVVNGQTLTGNAGLNILNTGGSRPHYNIQPFLGVNYIIALQGIFPSRN